MAVTIGRRAFIRGALAAAGLAAAGPYCHLLDRPVLIPAPPKLWRPGEPINLPGDGWITGITLDFEASLTPPPVTLYTDGRPVFRTVAPPNTQRLIIPLAPPGGPAIPIKRSKRIDVRLELPAGATAAISSTDQQGGQRWQRIVRKKAGIPLTS